MSEAPLNPENRSRLLALVAELLRRRTSEWQSWPACKPERPGWCFVGSVRAGRRWVSEAWWTGEAFRPQPDVEMRPAGLTHWMRWPEPPSAEQGLREGRDG